MELKQVRGQTWYLEGFELMPLYRIDDSRCILLDSGLLEEREALVETLDANGLVPVGIFSSHTHRDHSINNQFLKAHYGCQLALPRGEAALCSSPLMLKCTYAAYSSQFLMERYGEMMGPVDVEVGAEDGVVNFCGVDFTVIHTGGHTPDHICTVTPDGVCYLADAMLAGGDLAAAKLPYHYNHETALDVMEQLRTLPYDAYIAAHKLVFSDINGVIDGNMALFRRKQQEILSVMEGDMTRDQISCAFLKKVGLQSRHYDRVTLYERNVHLFLEYMTDYHMVEVVILEGCVHYRKVD